MSLVAQGAAAGGGTAEVVVFWVFGVLALGSAIAVITLRNIVHGALMLVLNLLSLAGLYLALETQFLSIIQVLVYAGAIMVLFLFVIMLLGVDRDDLLVMGGPRTSGLVVAGTALLAGALLFAFVGPYTSPASVCGEGEVATTTDDGVRCIGLAETLEARDDGGAVAFLGQRLFTRHTYAFELSALLLTVATIGAVIMARRRDIEPEDDLPAEPEEPPAPDAADERRLGDPLAVGADLAGERTDPGSDEPSAAPDDRGEPGREG